MEKIRRCQSDRRAGNLRRLRQARPHHAGTTGFPLVDKRDNNLMLAGGKL